MAIDVTELKVRDKITIGTQEITGVVTSVTGTSPIASSGGTTPAISVASGYTIPTSTEKGNYDTAYTDTSGATNANTASKIVKRDASGNFSAGTITANLTGTASGNLTSSSTLDASKLSGTIPAAVAQTEWDSAYTDTSAATNANTASTIVKRDASGNFSAGTITASLTGTASGNLTSSSTLDASKLSGTIPAAVAQTEWDTAYTDTNAATNANTASTIVKRDASGNFSAGTITASLTGTASGNITKTGSRTAGYVPTWGNTDGGSLDNGYSVETTLSGASTALPRADAVKTYIDGILSASDAMVFKGTVGTGGTYTITNFNALATYQAGWSYKVIEAGTIKGKVCEIGDLVIATVDRAGSGNVDADWTAVQTNIDGAVTGPASSTSGNISTFNGTTGKVIQDSGISFETTLTTNSDAKVPTSKAISTYVTGLGYVTSSGVTSVGATSPIASSGGTTPTISVASGYTIPTSTEKGYYDSAYTHSTTTTGSVHGSTTVGGNLLRLTNVTTSDKFLRVNYTDNSVSALDAAAFRTAIGAGTGNGTVTSVTGTSPVASSGGTTPAISLSSGYGDTLNPYASKTANYVLASPNGTAGVPTFRALVSSDIPPLSYLPLSGGTLTGLLTIPTSGVKGTTEDGYIQYYTSNTYGPYIGGRYTATERWLNLVGTEVGIYGSINLNGTTLTPTATELNFVDGVTSSIQVQLDNKAPLSSPTFTGTVKVPSSIVSLAYGTESNKITFDTAQTFTGPYIFGSVQELYRGYYLGQYKIWDAGNHGSGSGLDADLLDGQHSSYYQPASTAITTSNIGSQSVNFANTAGVINYYGSTSTAMTTAAKTATLTSFALTVGAIYAITFTNGSYVASPTLNLNSSGAKNIRVHNATATAASFNLNAGDTAIMVYDGTYYQVLSITKAQKEPVNYLGAASAAQNTNMTVTLNSNTRAILIQMLQDSSTSNYTIGQLTLTVDDTYSLGSTTRYYRMTWYNGSGNQNLQFQYSLSGNTLTMQHNFAFTMGVRVYELGG